MSTAVGVSKEHITKTPGVCGGKACIAGHRIRVLDVVLLKERQNLTLDEIVEQYPGILLSDVQAALSYAADNADEIHFDLESDRRVAEDGLKQTSKYREALARSGIAGD